MSPQLSRTEMEAKIISKAWQDRAFRDELIADPRTSIEKEFGIRLPDGIHLQVLPEDARNFYVVLPANPNVSGENELSEMELEAVAGGKCSCCETTTGTSTSGTGTSSPQKSSTWVIGSVETVGVGCAIAAGVDPGAANCNSGY